MQSASARLGLSDAEEGAPSGSLGEARLSETPYKHEVRHAVTGSSPPSLAPRGGAVCPETEEVIYAKSLGEARL